MRPFCLLLFISPCQIFSRVYVTKLGDTLRRNQLHDFRMRLHHSAAGRTIGDTAKLIPNTSCVNLELCIK